MTWIDDLDVGDAVLVERAGGDLALSAVSEVLSTSIKVGGQRFSKSTGVGWGQSMVRVLEVTPSNMASLAAQDARGEALDLVAALGRVDDPSAALEHLRAAVAAL